MTFINSFENSGFDKREYLLGWLFSSLEGHHSFAFELAAEGLEKFNYQLFNELKNYSKNRMKREVYRLKFLPAVVPINKEKIFIMNPTLQHRLKGIHKFLTNSNERKFFWISLRYGN